MDVTNTSDRGGDETVQLYIRDKASSVTRPVKELRGSRRVTLTPHSLEMWNDRMKRVVEPGDFKIMTGPNSVDLQNVTLTVES